jgi:hypothetical protein
VSVMPQHFKLFEPMTGELVGTLHLQEDLLPGSVALRYFQQGVVLVEETQAPAVSTVTPAPANAAIYPPKKSKR